MKKPIGFALAVAALFSLGQPLLAQGGGHHPRRAAILKQFDKNGDGKLDQTERAAMKAAMLEKFDANHDGKLDQAEKKALREALGRKGRRPHRRGEGRRPRPAGEQAPGARGQDARPGGRRLLERFDRNQDGKLDQVEREAARAALKARLDRNGDGRVGPLERRALRREVLRRALHHRRALRAQGE